MLLNENKHLTNFTPEFRLLCAILSCITNQKKLIWDLPIDYTVLKKTIATHNLSSLLYSKIQDFEVLHAIEDFLNRSSKKSLINHLKLKADFLKLWDILQQHNFKISVYKGHYLIDAIYNEKNIRTSTDIDILIEEKDLWKIKNLLLSLGYTLVYPEYDLPEHKASLFKKIENEIAFYTPNGCAVDLHFKLFKNPYILKTKHWETFVTVHEGRKMEVLPLPKIFAYLIVHGKKHDWNRLKWLLDIVQFYNIFKEEDWNLVDEIIKENDLEYMFYETLQLCEVLLGAKIPIRYQQNVLTVLADNFNPHKVLFPAKNKFFKNLQVLWEKKSWKYFWHQILQFPARDLYWINITFLPRLLHPIARPFIFLFIIRNSNKK